MSHTCHAPGCTRQVPPAMFACRAHWYALEKRVRDAIWREYRNGQEIDKRPSVRYLAVQRYACANLVFKPNDEGAALETAQYLAEAFIFRKRAITLGLGDPLHGLVRGDDGEKKTSPAPGGETLFAKVRGNAKIWRVSGYDERVLYMDSPKKNGVMVAPKINCRVGRKDDWRTNSLETWMAGGGELFR